jgi:ubiquinone/menaquinone biosynthesis C-methylase UbiE
MNQGGWDAIAAWRDSRMGERGDLWHRAIIDPTLLSVVGRVRGLRVLDIGCGNGYLTRRWAREGATRSVGFDLSSASLKYAHKREERHPTGARFIRGNSSDLARFEDGSFDLVVANMSLMDIEDAEGTIHEVGRVLAPMGRFVFSISHPCFDIDLQSTWVVERKSWGQENLVSRRVSGYRTEKVVRVPWFVSKSKTAYTISYHRPLSTYSRYLRAAGMTIMRLEEPSPKPEAVRESPQGPFMLEIPLHLVVESRPYPARSRRTRAAVPVTPPGSRRTGRTPGADVRRSGSRARRPGTGSARRGSKTES